MAEKELLPFQVGRHLGACHRLPVRGHDLQHEVAFPVRLDIGSDDLLNEGILAFKEGGYRRMIVDGSRGRVQCFSAGFD